MYTCRKTISSVSIRTCTWCRRSEACATATPSARPCATAPSTRCADHTPVDEDVKQVPFGESAPGASGVELLLPLTLKWAREMGVPLMRALDLISWKPSQILGVPGGNLSVGGYADVCIFDESAEWVVTSKTLASQGDNTPFLDHPMKGRVRYTVIDGHIDFEAPR